MVSPIVEGGELRWDTAVSTRLATVFGVLAVEGGR